MTFLELLAPARNADIGIAAVDCGADAVYIAGPGFGARKDAGNSIEDLARLCSYAHRFGVRIFVTVNTIVFDSELSLCYRMMLQAQEAGADALIVQDPALIVLASGGPDGKGPKISIPLHASTQCAIRSPEKARALYEAGFSRLVLERHLSLDQIRDIASATPAETEAFVHGALCVAYSGECYLSEMISGRSANRGACMQACRERYDLLDPSGKVLCRNKALLSLKDLCLIDRLLPMAEAGVTSFKIEGRLKNMSYVKNVVKAYSDALDGIIAENPGRYARSSFGRSEGCSFTPNLEKTFNRGYTRLFIDGSRSSSWGAIEAPKSMGQKLGKVLSAESLPGGRVKITVDTTDTLRNGDGFAFVRGGAVEGFRGDLCQGNTATIFKRVPGLEKGVLLYRNLSSEFEKVITSDKSHRVLDTVITPSIENGAEEGLYILSATAVTADGRSVRVQSGPEAFPAAENRGRMLSLIQSQLSKSSAHYAFRARIDESLLPERLPLVGASRLNALRRQAAEALEGLPCTMRPMKQSRLNPGAILPRPEEGYKANVANLLSEKFFPAGEKAYELSHRKPAELMRSKFCLRYELGLCPRQGKGTAGTLLLAGNSKTLELQFHCSSCEMSVVG